MAKKTLRIATRKSPLALLQANFVRKKLLSVYPDWNFYLIPMSTNGDNFLKSSFSKLNGKGIFMKELELALINNTADIAIHSMKDVPVNISKKLCLASICKRDNPLDALISNYYSSIDRLPFKAKIGTSSLRRKCQLINYRSDLNVLPLRGNIETRLKKLDEGIYDAIVLAVAGLNRLKLKHRIQQIIPPELLLPPGGQGAIGIQSRSNDLETIFLVKVLTDEITDIEIQAERAFCKKMNSSCKIPIGSYAKIFNNNQIKLKGLIGLPNGKKILKEEAIGPLISAKDIGNKLAKKLLKMGAKNLLKKHYSKYFFL
jgi:hydroxymethylbilane synthase